jgi:RNA polymerase sigma factor (TIGR02999 family)
MSDVTRILGKIEAGDPKAADELLPLIYHELKRLAAAKMAQESPDHTLQATALVHEAYLRLVDVEKAQKWDSRGHFFAAAAEAMRRILIDGARRKKSLRRGGNLQRQPADLDDMPQADPADDLLSIDEALRKLEREKPLVGKLVELRYFAGLTLEESAAFLGVSPRTADSYWAYARGWLHRELHPNADC